MVQTRIIRQFPCMPAAHNSTALGTDLAADDTDHPVAGINDWQAGDFVEARDDVL
jgi:hypothetical protein